MPKPQKTEICKTETLLLYKKEGNEMDIGPGCLFYLGVGLWPHMNSWLKTTRLLP